MVGNGLRFPGSNVQHMLRSDFHASHPPDPFRCPCTRSWFAIDARSPRDPSTRPTRATHLQFPSTRPTYATHIYDPLRLQSHTSTPAVSSPQPTHATWQHDPPSRPTHAPHFTRRMRFTHTSQGQRPSSRPTHGTYVLEPPAWTAFATQVRDLLTRPTYASHATHP